MIHYFNFSDIIVNKYLSMQYRYLGPTGIKVSVISYGNWVNSSSQ